MMTAAAMALRCCSLIFGQTTPDGLQAFPLLAFPIEILLRKPSLIRGADERPLAVDDREPGRVAVLALHHHVLAEQALVGETETQSGALRRFVAVVALPLQPAI